MFSVIVNLRCKLRGLSERILTMAKKAKKAAKKKAPAKKKAAKKKSKK